MFRFDRLTAFGKFKFRFKYTLARPGGGVYDRRGGCGADVSSGVHSEDHYGVRLTAPVSSVPRNRPYPCAGGFW
jgi:hypothetical protein